MGLPQKSQSRYWSETMSIKVIIPTALRQHTNNEDELQLNSRDVKGALQELVTAFPNLKRYLYSDNGRLRNFINIYLNEEDIRYISGETTPLKDGDTLMIVPSVAGGSALADPHNVTFSSSEFATRSSAGRCLLRIRSASS